jgi:hypothetical protein
MRLPKVSPEETARLEALLAHALRAAFVMTKAGCEPRLVDMCLLDEAADNIIHGAWREGFTCGGVVALRRDRGLCYERLTCASVKDMEDARNLFGVSLMLESCAATMVTN